MASHNATGGQSELVLFDTSNIPYEVKDIYRNTIYLGIDFGTSTSVVSYIWKSEDEAVPTLHPLDIEQPKETSGTIAYSLVNTVLAWKNGNLLWGRDAYRLKQEMFEGRNVFSSFKMRLGIDVGPTYPDTLLSKKANKGYVIESAKDATTEFFKKLLGGVRTSLQRDGLPQNYKCTVTVPASFEANQRRDLIDAMTSAGLDVDEGCLVDEPNAAFLSFVNDIKEKNDPSDWALLKKMQQSGAIILVYDFGAGTCDISILEITYKDGFPHSRNMAISRFTALGGDDIDRAIAKDILLDQLLESCPGYSPESRRIEEYLVPRLQPAAERLKIAAIRWLDAKGINSIEQANIHFKHTIHDNGIPKFSITEGGEKFELSLNDPHMTIEEFFDATSHFIEDYTPRTRRQNVFAPIVDALEKAGKGKSDLDAVLFIGGSCENQLVRKAVMRQLPDSVKQIVPDNLQSHVSLGAAIHSLSYNAYHNDLICPITPERICIITRDEDLAEILPASSEVPSKQKQITKLQIARDGQSVVELPICVGKKSKLIGILKIHAKNTLGFNRGDEVSVSALVTHEKLLKIAAEVKGISVATDLMNPLSNEELTPEETRLLKAKQAFNTARLQFGSKLPVFIVNNYAQAALDAENYELAVEMFKAAERIDPNQDHAVNIDYSYSKLNKTQESYEWAKEAYRRRPSRTSAFNLSLHETGSKKEQLLREALSYGENEVNVLVSLGELLLKSERKPEGRGLLLKAIHILKSKYDRDQLTQYECYFFIRAAKALDMKDMAALAAAKRDELANNKNLSPYDERNLVASINPSNLSRMR
ncbi:MAG: Hsp70 family protein [Desulfovibrio sp.]|jgi:molecular chaperone DnaK (HSP70)|nr:Hsp70 family protein [Desulfovibrio sp.]